LAFIPIAAGDKRYDLALWNLADRKVDRTIEHGSMIRNVSFSLDGKRLASASWGHFKVVLLKTGIEVQTLPTSNDVYDYAECVAFSAERLLATLESHLPADQV